MIWIVIRLHRIHEMQTIVTNVPSVCLSQMCRMTPACLQSSLCGVIGSSACSVCCMLCVLGHSIQLLPNAFWPFVHFCKCLEACLVAVLQWKCFMCVYRCVSISDIHQLRQCELDQPSPVCLHHCQSVGSHSYHSHWLHTTFQRCVLQFLLVILLTWICFTSYNLSHFCFVQQLF